MSWPLTLAFAREGSWELLREAAGAAAEAIGLEAAAWREASRTALPDANGSSSDAFEAEWTRPGGALREEARSGYGNPRDGYGYDLSWRLELRRPGGPTVKVGLSDAAWGPQPKTLTFVWEGVAPRELDRVREALRGVLGAACDRTDWPQYARDNVRGALDVDPDLARRWLAAALSAPGEPGDEFARRDLFALELELSGPSPELLRRRLAETPFDPAAWEDALSGEHRALAAATLRRLRPADPTALELPPGRPPGGWRRLEDGVGPRRGAWLPALVDSLARDLWRRGGGPWQELTVDVVHDGDRTAASAVCAAWSATPLESPLLMRVIRTARRYSRGWSDRPDLERVGATPEHESAHAWVWGPDADDCVQVRQEARRSGAGLLHLGVLCAVAGSASFRALAEAALEHSLPSIVTVKSGTRRSLGMAAPAGREGQDGSNRSPGRSRAPLPGASLEPTARKSFARRAGARSWRPPAKGCLPTTYVGDPLGDGRASRRTRAAPAAVRLAAARASSQPGHRGSSSQPGRVRRTRARWRGR